MYTDYHNLTAYNKAKKLTLQIINLFPRLPNNAIFTTIYHQIIRSASSIGANIAEGYGRNNTKEYRQFLGVARGSSFETEYWLEIIQESSSLKIPDIIDLNKEIIKILTVTIKNLGN